MDYLILNEILVEEQYWFCAGHSTAEKILFTYDNVCKQFDSKQVVGLILFDFEKAFDKGYHYILSTNLLDLDIDCAVLHWIYQFFTNRYTRVRSIAQV